MSDPQFASFAEFWPYYLREHSKPATRALHFLGTTVALAALVAAAIWRNPWLVLVAPLIGYGVAWPSHLTVERNRPATFKHPWWSLAADMKLWWLMSTGRMQRELRRHRIAPFQQRVTA